MRWKMLFKFGLSVVICVGILLFYLVTVQEDDYSRKHHHHTEAGVMNTNMAVLLERADKDAKKIKLENDLIKKIENNVQAIPFEDEIVLEGNKQNGWQNEEVIPFVQDSKHEEASDVGIMPEVEMKAVSAMEILDRSMFKQTYLSPVMKSSSQSGKGAVHLCVVVCGERGQEAMAMLKSAVLVTTSQHIVIHVLTEPATQKFFQESFDHWPRLYRQRISYNIYNVTFPEGHTAEAWKKLFRPCASQRLFLPNLLKAVDSLVYVDTDVLFLRSLSDLWSHFSRFNQSQLTALVPEAEDATGGWYNRFASHPFYGQFGVNSGVMLMNLTRLRQTTWLSEMQTLYHNYSLMIPWGDQDLINIYFSKHPDQLYLLTCEWNYRTDHCKYVSNCKPAENNGVSALHGSRRTFSFEKEPAFASVFSAFRQLQLGDDLELQFLYGLNQSLQHAKMTSNCGKVTRLLLHHLQQQAQAERNSMLQAQAQMRMDTKSQMMNVNDEGSKASASRDSGKQILFSHKHLPVFDRRQEHEVTEVNMQQTNLEQLQKKAWQQVDFVKRLQTNQAVNNKQQNHGDVYSIKKDQKLKNNVHTVFNDNSIGESKVMGINMHIGGQQEQEVNKTGKWWQSKVNRSKAGGVSEMYDAEEDRVP